MKIGQYCQRQRCKHVELEQFWHAFASRGFVSDSWAFLFSKMTSDFIGKFAYFKISCRNLACRWLDVKEDDGLTVREITAGGTQMLASNSLFMS